MEKFKVIIVEDVPLELKGTEGILRNDIPEAEIIGTAASEQAYWRLIKDHQPDLVLLDLGLGGSTTVGVEICRQTKQQFPAMRRIMKPGAACWPRRGGGSRPVAPPPPHTVRPAPAGAPRRAPSTA